MMSCLQRIISEVDSSLQALVRALQEATSLEMMLLVAWRLALQLALLLVEEEMGHRSQQPTVWPSCQQCGKPLESKGFGLFGISQGKATYGGDPIRRIGDNPPGRGKGVGIES